MANSATPNPYMVEKGIPLPAFQTKRYPFATMQIGDSFALDTADIHELERVRAAASYFGIRNKPVKFSIRVSDPTKKTYRCWRVA